jgi:hypothetical protein
MYHKNKYKFLQNKSLINALKERLVNQEINQFNITEQPASERANNLSIAVKVPYITSQRNKTSLL